jgi:hypothetical protein
LPILRGVEKLYEEDFTVDEREKIIGSINQALGVDESRPEKVWGQQIEDRGKPGDVFRPGSAASLGRKGQMGPRLLQAEEP